MHLSGAYSYTNKKASEKFFSEAFLFVLITIL